jgi:hypothetical protein
MSSVKACVLRAKIGFEDRSIAPAAKPMIVAVTIASAETRSVLTMPTRAAAA